MNVESRIPKLGELSFDGALVWFSELQTKDILFHPEDDPSEIVTISNGEQVFTDTEVAELKFLLGELESNIGHEKILEAAYPVFMKAFGNQLDA
jgi:hypothetical protein